MPTISRPTSAASLTAARATRPGEAPHGRDGIPTALKEAEKKQAAQYTDAAGKPVTVHYDGRDMPFGEADRSRLPKGSYKAMLNEMKRGRDAGNAVVVANNATLHTLTYCYGTHKPMEAWVTNTPKDGKLSLNLIATPSIHVGSNNAECQKNFDNYAKTNNYNVEVVYPDGSREVKKFDVEGNSPPQYGNNKPAPMGQAASGSPTIEIDLAKWAGKGNIHIRGWADGSSVGGYIEHRETILHV